MKRLLLTRPIKTSGGIRQIKHFRIVLKTLAISVLSTSFSGRYKKLPGKYHSGSCGFNMLTVAHVSPTYYSDESVVGGGEKIVVYYCRALRVADRDEHVQNKVIAFGNRESNYRSSEDMEWTVLQAKPWQVHGIRADLLRSGLADVDIVLVYQCLHPVGLFVAAQARLLNKIVIGMDFGAGEHPLVHCSPSVGRLFNTCIANSDFNLSSFIDLDVKSVLIRGTVDTDFYTPLTMQRFVGRRLVAVGRILPHKGFDRIINSLHPLQELTIFGSRSNDDAYYNYLREIARTKSVNIVEGLSDESLKARIQNADLFVHASTHADYLGRYYHKPELIGLAPLEALSCGTPTLVSTAGSLPELTMISGCRSFQDDHDLRQTLAADAEGVLQWPSRSEIHRDTKAKFGLEVFGRQLLDVIAKAMS